MRRRAESLGAFLSHGSASSSELRVSVHGHGHSQPCSRRCCLRGPGAAGVGISPRGTSLWRHHDSARGSGLLLPAVHTQRGDSPRARPSLRQPSGVRSRPGRRGRPEGGGAVGERPGETHRDELESDSTLLLSASAVRGRRTPQHAPRRPEPQLSQQCPTKPAPRARPG